MARVFLLTIISWACFVSGNASNFIYPPPFPSDSNQAQDRRLNTALSVGQNVVLEWNTPDFQALDLWLMQDGGVGVCEKTNYRNATCKQIGTVDPNDGNMIWTVSRMGMTLSPIYYIFAFNKSLNAGVEFNTRYINITNPSQSSSSKSASTSSTRASTTLSGTPSTSSETLSTQSPSPSMSPTLTTSSGPVSTSSLAATSAGANSKLANAVGAGVGVPLGLIALAVLSWFFYRYRKEHKKPIVLEASPSPKRPQRYLDGSTFSAFSKVAGSESTYVQDSRGCALHEMDA